MILMRTLLLVLGYAMACGSTLLLMPAVLTWLDAGSPGAARAALWMVAGIACGLSMLIIARRHLGD